MNAKLKEKLRLHKLYAEGALGGKRLNLEYHKFDKQDLRGVDLRAARLVNCSFVGCDLREALFACAELRGCNFSKADLRNVDFTYSDIRGASFEGALTTNTLWSYSL